MTSDRPIFAKRSLGQNFLCDPNTARKIVEQLGLRPGDTVLEIGPGRGALTGFLLNTGATVLALEKDGTLASELIRKFPGLGVANVDALEFSWERLEQCGAISLIGNLPYNIASPLIWELVSRSSAWLKAVFMVQKEVGLRLCASPGSKTYGALSAWVQSFVTPVYEFTVGPSVFKPQPKVDSAVVSFRLLPVARRNFDAQGLSALLKTLFQQRRKQIGVILRKAWNPELEAVLQAVGLDRTARPEVLSPMVLQRLADVTSGVREAR